MTLPDRELRELLEQATPGEWTVRDDPGSSFADLYMEHHFAAAFSEADARLIAAAPALAEEVLRLRGALRHYADAEGATVVTTPIVARAALQGGSV